MKDLFGQLRSLFEGPATRLAFMNVLSILIELSDDAHVISEHTLLPYIREKLDAWYASHPWAYPVAVYEPDVDPQYGLALHNAAQFESLSSLDELLFWLPVMRSISCEYEPHITPAIIEFLTGTSCTRLEVLSLESQINGQELALLRDAEGLSTVHTLMLARNILTSSDLLALSDSALFSGLRCLDLSHNPLTWEVAPLFLDKFSRSLQVLDVSYSFGGEDLAQLCAVAMPHLQVMTLSMEKATAQTWRALCHAPWPELQYLELYHLLSVEPADIESLSRSAWASQLRYLSLSYGAHGDVMLRLIARGEGFEQLIGVSVSGMGGHARAARLLLSSPKMATLEVLGLWDTRLDDTVWSSLAALDAPALHSLDLGMTGLTDDGARALAKANLPGLTRLTLSNNPLTSEGMLALSEAPWFGQLTHLNLAETQMGDRGLIALCDQARCLTHFELNFCPVGEEGLHALANAAWTSQLLRFEHIVEEESMEVCSAYQSILKSSPHFSQWAKFGILEW